MAVNPENYFTGDGSTTSFVFTFEYIDETDVKVSVDGTVQATTAYSFANATTILFDTAPAADTEVRIYRDTNVDELKSTFFAGSSIRAQDLNQNFEQNNFAVQEIKAYTWDNETQTIHSDETWVSSDAQIATTAAMDQRFQDEAQDTLTKAELAALSDVIPDNDDAVPTTGAVKDYVDHVIETDILVDGTGLNKTGSSGQVTIGISAGSVDLDRIKPADIVDSTETWSATDTQVATTQAIEDRIDEIITNDIGTDGTGITVTDDGDGTITLGLANNSIDLARIKNADIITSGEADPDNDTTIATTAKIGDMIDVAIANDITSDGSGVTVTDDGDGTITLSVEEGALNLNRINAGNIVTESEQDAGITEADTTIFTTLAAAKRFDTLVQTASPSGSAWEVGKTWLQNDDDLTLSIWNGTGWTAVSSGGTFTEQPSVVYVDQASGDDNNTGHRISTPKATIKAAINQINAEIGTEITSGGSGYVEGSYTTVALTGGNGTGLTADITVNASGVVSAVTVNSTTTLEDYSIGDVLSASNADLGGSGSGLQITVNGDGDGQIVVVSAGTYQEVAPIQIKRRNVSIIGQALRSCIVHPTSATENNVLFELNSGSYIANLTLTGMQAGTGTGNTLDATLPTTQGWNFAFYEDAFITKSPYIQNCTNFSDSEIDNDDLRSHRPRGGTAGDLDSAPTGGGMLVNGATPHDDSPLRSMVADSYTHVGLNGPGILVTNNGYAQITSSYAFFNKYHIKCLNGGQANLAASTTDFGDQALVADGRSTNAIFTSTTFADAADQATEFFINGPTARTATPLPWHGSSTRPQSNMLVDIGGNTYPILSASNTFASTEIVSGRDYTILTVGDTDFTAIGAASNTVGVQFTATGVGTGSGTVTDDTGWRVTISRPDPNNRNNNLGLDGAVTSGGDVDFFLRSQVASSGHTMEYVGSGTNYSALPENGGVPDESKQITESNNGKVWTAITDHNGKFKIGGNQTTDPIFEVDQQTGFITIPEGSIAFNLLSDITPQLGGDLDVNGNTITGLSNPTANDEVANKAYVDSVAGTPTQIAQLNTSVQTSDTGTDGTITFTNDGSESARFDSSGRLLVGTSTARATGASVTPAFQVEGTSNNTSAINLVQNNSSATFGSTVHLGKTRGTSNGATTVVQSGENLGSIHFDGADGSSMVLAARIFAAVDGTPGANDMPGRLVFSTTADGAASPTERMRIDSSGNVGVGTTSPSAPLTVASSGGTNVRLVGRDNGTTDEAQLWFVHNDDSTVHGIIEGKTTSLNLYGGTTLAQTIDSSGRVGIGTSSPSYLLDCKGTGTANVARFLTGSTSSSEVAQFGRSDQAVNLSIDYDGTGSMGIGTTTAHPFNLKTGAVTRATIDTSGRLGIGTTSPGYRLHVDSATTTDAAYLGNGYGGLVFGCNSSGERIINTNASGPILFQRGGTESARIDSSGRLLVGTSTAQGTAFTTPIQVKASGSLGGGYSIVSANDENAGGILLASSTTNALNITADPDNQRASTTINFTVDGTERLRIASTGAFGLSGANYGTSGQVLTSQGSGSAPQWATPATPAIVQKVVKEYSTASTLTSPYIPFDNSVPQSSETILLFTQSFTPISTSNKLFLTAQIGVMDVNSGGNPLLVGIWDNQPGGASARAVAWHTPYPANYAQPVRCEYQIGGTLASSYTFSVRVGSTGGTWAVNRRTDSQYFGGTVRSHLTIEEFS